MTEDPTYALYFARKAHGSQMRKGGDPYWTHLVEVRDLVARVTKRRDVLCAALLHDVLEDTPVKREELIVEFGERVTSLVVDLTDHYTPSAYPDLNRERRKSLERQRLGLCPPWVQTVKVADLISNTRTITMFDRGFSHLYLEEKRALLYVLTRAHHRLLQLARWQLIGAAHKLKEGR